MNKNKSNNKQCPCGLTVCNVTAVNIYSINEHQVPKGCMCARQRLSHKSGGFAKLIVMTPYWNNPLSFGDTWQYHTVCSVGRCAERTSYCDASTQTITITDLIPIQVALKEHDQGVHTGPSRYMRHDPDPDHMPRRHEQPSKSLRWKPRLNIIIMLVLPKRWR